jgi:hypothetical protein
MEALGGSRAQRLVRVAFRGLQRSVREWAVRQGWGGRPVDQKQAQGILLAALGVLTSVGRRQRNGSAGRAPYPPSLLRGVGGLAKNNGTVNYVPRSG